MHFLRKNDVTHTVGSVSTNTKKCTQTIEQQVRPRERLSRHTLDSSEEHARFNYSGTELCVLTLERDCCVLGLGLRV